MDCLFPTYIFISHQLGAPASLALRMVHAAGVRSAHKFEEFVADLVLSGFPFSLLECLRPKHAVYVICKLKAVSAEAPFLLLLGIDEFNKVAAGSLYYRGPNGRAEGAGPS